MMELQSEVDPRLIKGSEIEAKNIQSAISNEREINFVWHRIVRFSNKLVTSRENTPE